MKQFIVLMAVIPVMLGLLMQVGLAQQNFTRLMRVEQIIEDYRWEASLQGGFSSGMRSELAGKLAEACGVPGDSIALSLDPPGASMSSQISYRIEIPGFRKVAANRLFGIPDADNEGRYVIEGSVPSRLEPPPEPSD